MARIIALLLALATSAYGFGNTPIGLVGLERFEGVGWCDSDLDEQPAGWTAEDRGAERCWTMCQEEFDDVVAIDYTDSEYDCWCQTDCRCMNNVGGTDTYIIPVEFPDGLPDACNDDLDYDDDVDFSRRNLRRSNKKSAAKKI